MKGYKDLLAEIHYHQHMLEAYRDSFEYWNKQIEQWKPKEMSAMQYSDMPKGSRNQPDTVDVLCKAITFKNRIDEEQQILNKLEEKKKLIDETLNDVDLDITVRVGYLRALGLTQLQVAELIDRSERQVRRIERKIDSVV